MALHLNFTKHAKEVTPLLLKVFHKIQEEGRLPNSFYEASINLISINLSVKDTERKENYRPIPLMNTDKIPQQNISKPNTTLHQKKIINHNQVRFIPEMQG